MWKKIQGSVSGVIYPHNKGINIIQTVYL